MRRVVITGIGPVTPVGIGLEVFWDALKSGKSGISRITNCDLDEFQVPVHIGGEIKNSEFKVENYFSDPKQVKSLTKDMDRFSQFAVIASKYAIEDSKINFSDLEKFGSNRSRVSTFIGTGIGGITTICDDTVTLWKRGPKAVGIRSIIRLMPNAASGHVAIMYGLQGRAKSDATACASGLDSIFDAFWYIRNNLADVMITGGAEACLTPLAITSFANMTALSKRPCLPEEASCPFDKRRDGFVMGEGSVVFVMEELELAKARGAHIYAELIGVGASCDAFHITAPSEDGSGGARAIESALQCAGLDKDGDKIDYIHAHGTSTPLNDARETMAIKKVFGNHAYKLCVSSTKSMTGHLIGAAGPAGVAAAALACKNNIIPPTINFKESDPVCDLDYVPNEARHRKVDYAIVQALGFGGHNTAVIVKKFD